MGGGGGCSGIKLAAFGTAPADAGGLAGFPAALTMTSLSTSSAFKLCSSSPHSGQSSKKLQTMRSSALTLSALVLLAVALCGSGLAADSNPVRLWLAEPKLPRLCGIRLIRKLYEVCKDRGGVYNGGLMRRVRRDTSSSSAQHSWPALMLADLPPAAADLLHQPIRWETAACANPR
uniref:Uncharacterized protein n=1 Tax=Macrostomum lignano TaxID=282301 RepID=A0A1I8FF71_9PLAT